MYNLNKEDITFLQFDKLEFYNDSFEILLYVIEYMKDLEGLDLSYMIVKDENNIMRLLDQISPKEKKFLLKIEGTYLNKDILKEIKNIYNQNKVIKIEIDNKYNGQMNAMGCKKMSFSNPIKENYKKKKHNRRGIEFIDGK